LIMAGMRLSMLALQNNTAKLSSVKIIKPPELIGRSTAESIQAGLYYSQLGALEKITRDIKQHYFQDQNTIVIGTGGFAYFFQDAQIIDHVIPDLVLHGLRIALLLNQI